MLKTDLKGYMEFKSFIPESTLNVSPKDLVSFADISQIHTFGWPIAPIIHSPQFTPTPMPGGIKCIIKHDDSFDFWSLKSDGEFYILKSLFEDRRGGGKIYFDSRIIRTMEVLWRTARLYKQMGASENDPMECELEYGGLTGRKLATASSRRMIMTTYEYKLDDPFKQQISSTVGSLLTSEGLLEEVHNYCFNLFQLFSFFDLKKEHTEQIVKAYFNGKTD